MRILPEPIEALLEEMGARPWHLAGALLAFWLVIALMGGTQTLFLFLIQEPPISFQRSLAQASGGWLLYGLLAPLILWLGEWLPIRGPRSALRALAHLGFALVLAALYSLGATLTWRLFGSVAIRDPAQVLSAAVLWYLYGLAPMVLAYFGVHGIGRALYWFARHRATEVAAARLEAQLAEARMSALQAQIHPHFLFNALNAVATLVRGGDARQAERIVHLLSELLREVIEHDRAATVRLTEEVAFVRKYLEIQEVRFPERLRISIEVPEELAGESVPAFVLQPLVENALRHGIAKRRDAGRLGVRAWVEGDALLLAVDDDGGGPRVDEKPGGGGLRNLRARLEVMYGPSASVTVLHNDWGGTQSRVLLPRRGGHG